MTLLVNINSKTIIFNMYRPCNSPIESVGGATVIKQQLLSLQEQNWNVHSHKVTLTDITNAIKKKRGYNFILLDENEEFIRDKCGIAGLYHEYKLHGPFTHLNETKFETKSHLRGSYRIDYYFCTYKLLKSIKLCDMTSFNDITSSNHCGFYLDL